jgi:hypothetical protein
MISMLSLGWKYTLAISNYGEVFSNAEYNVVAINELQLVRSNLFQIYLIFIGSLHVLVSVVFDKSNAIASNRKFHIPIKSKLYYSVIVRCDSNGFRWVLNSMELSKNTFSQFSGPDAEPTHLVIS